MSFLGKLTGGGVDWDVALTDAGAGLLPGATVHGRARFTVKRDIDSRAVIAALIGTAEWKVEVSRRGSDRQVETDSRWNSEDLGRAESRLSGPARYTNGQTTELEFALTLPPGAPPSVDTGVLRVKWELEVKLDVGGADPSANIPVRVVLPVASVQASGSALGLTALSARSDSADAAIEISPVPLVAGKPFTGVVETGEALKNARIEIKLEAQVTGRDGALAGALQRDLLNISSERGQSETKSVWVGELRDGGAGPRGRRFEFSGVLPADASPTVQLANGRTTATVDVVVSRRFMPDRHLVRDVAIASGE